MSYMSRSEMAERGLGWLFFFVRAYVIQHYWNWFAAPTFNIASLSLLHTIALLALLELFSPKTYSFDKVPWDLIGDTVDLLLPPDKLEKFTHLLEKYKERNQPNLIILAAKTTFMYATYMLVGFVLHCLF